MKVKNSLSRFEFRDLLDEVDEIFDTIYKTSDGFYWTIYADDAPYDGSIVGDYVGFSENPWRRTVSDKTNKVSTR